MACLFYQLGHWLALDWQTTPYGSFKIRSGWDSIYILWNVNKLFWHNCLLPPPKKEVMFLVQSVCLSVCLSVCPSDYSQTCERILTEFFVEGGHGSRTKWYNFGGDPDHASNPGVQSPKSGSSGLLKKLLTDLCHAVFSGGLCSLSASSSPYVSWVCHKL